MRSSSTILIWAYLLFLYVYTSSSFSSSAPLYFPANNVTLFGDASVENDSIRLTQDHQCTSPSQSTLESASSTSLSGIGRAFYINPIRFLDSSSKGTAASFSCSFSFNISPTPSCPFGDGLAFLVTSNMDSLSITDGWMGLPEEVSNTQDSFIAVEFDTSYNPFFDDINGNHVGIDVRQIKSLASVDVVSRGIDLKAGKEMTAWIEYRNSEKMIRVWVGYSQVRPLSPILVAQADFTGDFKEFMHVGFTASNGGGSAIHSISRWRFKTFWFRSSTLSMDTVEEGDCLACFPGDLDLNFDHSRKWKFGLILVIGGSAVITVILVAVALFVILCCIKRNRSKAKRERHIEYHIGRFQSYKVPKYLSLSEIKEATKGFKEDRIIGEGASAVVYEGEIPSCGNVAIKRFTRGKSIGPSHNSFDEAWRIPFDNEFATMIGCLRHKNLVQLKGWCCERNELVLVYEYMPNGSLDKILHGRSSVTKFLTWERRSNIVLGVASALVYLHEECINQIIHRDVKACNIMLDAEFNAKLGDFGLAAVYQRSLEIRDATVPAGTMGYLAPEYVFSGVPTVKTDVYSFGVVVLEVASGRRPVDDNRIVITDWVWELWGKGKLIEAADPKLKRCFTRKVMGRMLMVGLCCTHPDHQKRPTMREAARMLQGEAPIPSLPPRKPTVRIQSVLPEGILEDIMSIGEEADDNTPWSTPRTQFSRN
ncbi:L-type lectin-domain containing receptor kinase S.6 [Coffea eugenioides]|uniref:L-type lectin-domain containing receptor kinase S.6 n=1 Tax=Coffea eugenioides TaxID=49369 RepID=UPI000F60F97A|nr:L-type lectin-domain containing receptor kinase S.6 [Coffea eugenioides]